MTAPGSAVRPGRMTPRAGPGPRPARSRSSSPGPGHRGRAGPTGRRGGRRPPARSRASPGAAATARAPRCAAATGRGPGGGSAVPGPQHEAGGGCGADPRRLGTERPLPPMRDPGAMPQPWAAAFHHGPRHGPRAPTDAAGRGADRDHRPREAPRIEAVAACAPRASARRAGLVDPRSLRVDDTEARCVRSKTRAFRTLLSIGTRSHPAKPDRSRDGVSGGNCTRSPVSTSPFSDNNLQFSTLSQAAPQQRDPGTDLHDMASVDAASHAFARPGLRTPSPSSSPSSRSSSRPA
jgi:hypothetical protein